MAILVDSNILVFLVWEGHPKQQVTQRAIEQLMLARVPLYVLPQNIAEFWNVCTRPEDRNGLGLSAEETNSRLTQLQRGFKVVYETREAYEIWRRLLLGSLVLGVQVHDARIAAGMLAHQVTRLLTYNPRDFGRFGVQCVTPEELLASL